MVQTIVLLLLLIHLFSIFLLFLFDYKCLSKNPIFIFMILYLPIFGFFAYIIFTESKIVTKKQIPDIKENDKFFELLDIQKNNDYGEINPEIQLGLSSNYLLTTNNESKLLLNVKDFYNNIYQDIENATKVVYLSYYIIRKDISTKNLIQLLERKSQEGIAIYIIYDYNGNLFNGTKKLLRNLKRLGATVIKFKSPLKRFKFNFNYFNHKKIAVIDDVIAYVGSTNFSRKELGLAKIKNWTDTSMRIVGDLAIAVKNDLLKILSQVYRKTELLNEFKNQDYNINAQSKSMLQLISSAPNYNKESIKHLVIKMMATAKQNINIMTPFLNIDKSTFDIIRIAVNSNVKVKIILPLSVDHRSTNIMAFSFIKELMEIGVEVYLYKGFNHTKLFIKDNLVVSYGSFNLEKHSFSSYYETNILIYDEALIKQWQEYFDNQLLNSIKIDSGNIKRYIKPKKIKYKIIRVFRPK